MTGSDEGRPVGSDAEPDEQEVPAVTGHDDQPPEIGSDVPTEVDVDAVRRVLARLRDLAGELDEVERCALAALIGPGVAGLTAEAATDHDGLVQWDPDALLAALRARAQERPGALDAG